LSIEKDILENIDVDVIINDFASQNALEKTTSYEFSRTIKVFDIL
jgi:putative heme degradation protein